MNRLAFHTIVVMLLPSVLSFAQLSPHYGIKLGAVAATQSWDYQNLVSTGNRWGFDIGGFVEPFRLGPFSPLAEVHYIQKGTKYINNGTVRISYPPVPPGKVITLMPRLDYLSFAVYGKLLIDASFVRPYALAGPRIDFVVGKEDDGLTGLYDHFKDKDVGATFGIGLEIPASMVSSILVEFRYSPSFTEGFDTHKTIIKNRSFEFLLGVQI